MVTPGLLEITQRFSWKLCHQSDMSKASGGLFLRIVVGCYVTIQLLSNFRKSRYIESRQANRRHGYIWFFLIKY